MSKLFESQWRKTKEELQAINRPERFRIAVGAFNRDYPYQIKYSWYDDTGDSPYGWLERNYGAPHCGVWDIERNGYRVMHLGVARDTATQKFGFTNKKTLMHFKLVWDGHDLLLPD